MRLSRKGCLLLTVFALSTASFLSLFGGCAVVRGLQGPDSAKGTIYVVKKGDIVDLLSISGKVVSDEEARIGFAASGTVRDVFKKEGDRVTKGEKIASLDDSKLKASLEQAQASVKLAESGLRTAQINLKNALDSNHIVVHLSEQTYQAAKKQVVSARHRMEDAEATLQKTQESLQLAQENLNEVLRYNQEHPGDTDYEKHMAKLNEINARIALKNAEASLLNAQAALSSAKDNYRAARENEEVSRWTMLQQQQAAAAQIKVTQEAVNNARAALEQARSALRLAELALADAELSSPIDGVIAAMTFKIGEIVTPQDYVWIVDPAHLHIEADMDEVDVARIAVGKEVDVQFDALPGTSIPGTVSYISPASETISASQGQQVAVTYKVKVKLNESSQAGLRPGMSANIQAKILARSGVLLVPSEYIKEENGKEYVYLIDERGRIRQKEVTTGYVSAEYAEILSGLKEGDKIVLR